MEEIVTLSNGTFYQLSECTVLMVTVPEVDIRMAKETMVFIQQHMARHGRQRVIVDIKPLKKITAEARMHYAQHECTPELTGVAFVVDNMLTRVFANFMLSINKMPCPTKIFTDREAATVWLESLPHETVSK